jgi:GT2 family glycosyltransferase
MPEGWRAAAPAPVDLTLPLPAPIGWLYRSARVAAWLRRRTLVVSPMPGRPTQPGISVVIPSRNGRLLLEAQLPALVRDLEGIPSEITVADNGSGDGTAEWLRAQWPQVEPDVSAEPLSFSAAVNRGIGRARFTHVCLLNNDMLLDPGFFAALRIAFDRVPGLFCATAQIRFPAGVRREETGKAVMAQTNPSDFPIRCDEPIEGEDLSYVLYGSGGCSLFDAEKLRLLGGVDEAYAPAYVEDLDLGYRAWQRGWPTVYVAGAMVEHRHRATTSRYYTPAELDEMVEVNYLRFLARAVSDPKLFRRLWRDAVRRLRNANCELVLRKAAGIALDGGPISAPEYPEERFLALASGDVAVFPGQAAPGNALVTFADRLEAPPALLASHAEVVAVRRGNQAAFDSAVQQTASKWGRPPEVRP